MSYGIRKYDKLIERQIHKNMEGNYERPSKKNVESSKDVNTKKSTDNVCEEDKPEDKTKKYANVLRAISPGSDKRQAQKASDNFAKRAINSGFNQGKNKKGVLK